MTYKKATSIELGKAYYERDDVGDYCPIEIKATLVYLLQQGNLYTKEETQADKVREILKTGWVKRKTNNEFLSVVSIRKDEVLFNSLTYGLSRCDHEDIISNYESTTYEKALESL